MCCSICLFYHFHHNVPTMFNVFSFVNTQNCHERHAPQLVAQLSQCLHANSYKKILIQLPVVSSML